MSDQVSVIAMSEQEMFEIAAVLAEVSNGRGVIYLSGPLGAGKTTFCRGILRFFGYQGAVKSPTFTLVEPYEINQVKIFHFDLYRLNDPNELEYIGLEDYFVPGCLCLLEWPEKGGDILPGCDLLLEIGVRSGARYLTFNAGSDRGQKMIVSVEKLMVL